MTIAHPELLLRWAKNIIPFVICWICPERSKGEGWVSTGGNKVNSKLFVFSLTLTVNVFSFSYLLGLNFAFSAVLSQNTWWNGKQCRPWSDCFFRWGLICVYTACICHYVRTFGVRNFMTFTVTFWVKFSADNISEYFSFFPENRIWQSCQILFPGKNKKNAICWIFTQSAKH